MMNGILIFTTSFTRRKSMKTVSRVLFLLLVLPAAAFAASGSGAVSSGAPLFFSAVVIVAGMGLSIAALGGSLGQGNLASKAMEAIARQPEASGRIQTAMLLGLAFVESLVIYVLLIAFILLFANPFIKFFGG